MNIRKHIASAGIMLCAFSMSATMPEHVYMFGPAMRIYEQAQAVELVNEGDGKFVYEGPVAYAGELYFSTEREGGQYYLAPGKGSWLTIDGANALVLQPANINDNCWWIGYSGFIRSTITVTEDGNKVSIETSYVAPQTLFAFGPALDNTQADAIEMQRGEDGSFSYKGAIHLGELYFSTSRTPEGCTYVGAPGKGSPIVDNGAMAYLRPALSDDLCWWVGQTGIIDIRISTDNEGLHHPTTFVAPEKVYMTGPATAVKGLQNAPELTATDNGRFMYAGPLYVGNMRLAAYRSEPNMYYMPQEGGSPIMTCPASVISTATAEFLPDNYYWVSQAGIYEIEFEITASAVTVTKAERTGELPEMLTLVGASVGPEYDNVYPWLLEPQADGTTFVWSGDLEPDSGFEHFKFASQPGAPGVITHYVPSEVEEGTNYKLVKAGQTYPYVEVNGAADGYNNYFGVADEDIEPMIVTIDKKAKTVSFAPRKTTGIESVERNPQISVSCFGGELTVTSATDGINVYDIAGSLVAFSGNSNLRTGKINAGIYIVKSGNAVMKVRVSK